MKPRSLSKRLGLVVAILTVVPLIFSLIIYALTSSLYKANGNRFSEQLVKGKIQALDSYYQDMNLILQQMVDQSDMLEFLSPNYREGELPSMYQKNLMAKLDNVLSIKQRQLSAAYIVSTDTSREVVFKKTMSYITEPIYRYRDYQVVKKTLQDPLTLWTFDWQNELPYITASLRVYSAQRDRPLGCMILRMNNTYFLETLGCNKESGISLILENENNEVVFSYGIDTDNDMEKNQFFNHYQCSAVSEASGWKLTLFIPYSQFDQEMKLIPVFLILNAVSLILLASIAIRLLLKWIYSPIHEISEAMKNFNISEEPKLSDSDELRDISQGFSKMQAQILSLIDDIRTEDEKRRSRELQMLQLQIMPHFLLNTLNSIRSLMTLNDKSRALDMLQALMGMLRMSLSDIRSTVSLSEEVNYMMQYVTVMSIRRNESINLEYEIDDECQACLVPKFLLQPLAENSIIHGFASMKDIEPKITLKAFRNENDLFIILEDNGLGMTEQQIMDATKTNKEKYSGIGLSNVLARIKLLYGENYGLQIFSSGVTKVELHLPYVKNIE